MVALQFQYISNLNVPTHGSTSTMHELRKAKNSCPPLHQLTLIQSTRFRLNLVSRTKKWRNKCNKSWWIILKPVFQFTGQSNFASSVTSTTVRTYLTNDYPATITHGLITSQWSWRNCDRTWRLTPSTMWTHLHPWFPNDFQVGMQCQSHSWKSRYIDNAQFYRRPCSVFTQQPHSPKWRNKRT